MAGIEKTPSKNRKWKMASSIVNALLLGLCNVLERVDRYSLNGTIFSQEKKINSHKK